MSRLRPTRFEQLISALLDLFSHLLVHALGRRLPVEVACCAHLVFFGHCDSLLCCALVLPSSRLEGEHQSRFWRVGPANGFAMFPRATSAGATRGWGWWSVIPG